MILTMVVFHLAANMLYVIDFTYVFYITVVFITFPLFMFN